MLNRTHSIFPDSRDYKAKRRLFAAGIVGALVIGAGLPAASAAAQQPGVEVGAMDGIVVVSGSNLPVGQTIKMNADFRDGSGGAPSVAKDLKVDARGNVSASFPAPFGYRKDLAVALTGTDVDARTTVTLGRPGQPAETSTGSTGSGSSTPAKAEPGIEVGAMKGVVVVKGTNLTPNKSYKVTGKFKNGTKTQEVVAGAQGTVSTSFDAPYGYRDDMTASIDDEGSVNLNKTVRLGRGTSDSPATTTAAPKTGSTGSSGSSATGSKTSTSKTPASKGVVKGSSGNPTGSSATSSSTAGSKPKTTPSTTTAPTKAKSTTAKSTTAKSTTAKSTTSKPRTVNRLPKSKSTASTSGSVAARERAKTQAEAKAKQRAVAAAKKAAATKAQKQAAAKRAADAGRARRQADQAKAEAAKAKSDAAAKAKQAAVAKKAADAGRARRQADQEAAEAAKSPAPNPIAAFQRTVRNLGLSS